MNEEIRTQMDLAHGYISTSKTIDDNLKALLYKVLNLTATSTNGLTPEEKIQRMTEGLFSLAVANTIFVCKSEAQINNVTSTLIAEHEQRCPLYNKHSVIAAKQVESANDDANPTTIKQCIVNILSKPYVYLFLTAAVFSPFITDILKAIGEIIK